jgi:hypothetical protein
VADSDLKNGTIWDRARWFTSTTKKMFLRRLNRCSTLRGWCGRDQTEASMELILIIVVVVLLFGGGGYWGRGRGYW